MNDYAINQINADGLHDALALVLEVFMEFEAPEYSDVGIREFCDYIAYDAMEKRLAQNELRIWGCYDGARIIGVIAIRGESHISLLFVHKAYHRQGIARALYDTARENAKQNGPICAFTVNSSPYAHVAYQHLDFMDTDTEQLENGLRFFPMRHEWNNSL